MIIISDNFSNSKKLLRKESKNRENDELPIDEILENDTWTLFYKLGFVKLNIGRECEVKYGKKETDLSAKKIDVIAESNEVRPYKKSWKTCSPDYNRSHKELYCNIL
ncbi:MAG: hypothetical protein HQ557_00280 [Bacteroidetes bacterium]|nr:hypothetical protein [Bacteroidota bacterium]